MWWLMALACGVGEETGPVEPPQWMGTQIGDEGGATCWREEARWLDEHGAAAAGALRASWQGERARCGWR